MIRRDGGLLQPEPTLEIIITLYDNREVGFQTNHYRGKPADPVEVIKLLSLMAQGVQRELIDRKKAPAPQQIEAHGLELFADSAVGSR